MADVNGLDKKWSKSKKFISFVVCMVALLTLAILAMVLEMEQASTVVLVMGGIIGTINAVHTLGQSSVDKILAGAAKIATAVTDSGQDEKEDEP